MTDLDALIRDLKRLPGRSRREAADALEKLRGERDDALAREAALREALAEIRDHDSATCPGITASDCLDVVQETARVALEPEMELPVAP